MNKLKLKKMNILKIIKINFTIQIFNCQITNKMIQKIIIINNKNQNLK